MGENRHRLSSLAEHQSMETQAQCDWGHSGQPPSNLLFIYFCRAKVGGQRGSLLLEKLLEFEFCIEKQTPSSSPHLKFPRPKRRVGWAGRTGRNCTGRGGRLGNPHTSVLLLLSMETPESAEHTRCVHTYTHAGRHVSDSITPLWDEGEILQPSALPIKLLLWGERRRAVRSYAVCLVCVCHSGFVRVLGCSYACGCACLTGEVCICLCMDGFWLWWCFIARPTQAWLVKCVCVLCVCTRPSDVTLYHFRLISHFLLEEEEQKAEWKEWKRPQTSDDAEMK